MLCAISGATPQVPVVSRKSGSIYEKRLIESYITENGTEPTTGESLTVEDLIDVQTTQTVQPRPPSLTSIPAMLSVFQEEWDSLALQVHNLERNLAQTRQELSIALYHQDAAMRVVARLTKERDEAREALAKINVGGRGADSANGTNGSAMQLDDAPLPASIIAKVDSTQERLMKTRRKRPIPEGWATSDDISTFTATKTTDPLYPGAKFLALNMSGDSVLLGGSDGVAGVYSVSQDQVVQTLQGGDGSISSGIWAENRAVIATSTGYVKIFEGSNEIASFRAHSGSVTGLTLHPSGDILASVSADKSFVLYDLESLRVLTQVFTDSELLCAQFHPDGHLLATGGADGQLKFYELKSGAIAATFETGSALKSLFFSENGTWIAAANSKSSTVSIWDLRKAGKSSDPLHTIEVGGTVESLNWDYSAQYLLIGGPGGLSVQQYSKSTKEWSEPLKSAVPANAVAWGPSAKTIFSIDAKGSLWIIS